MKSTIALFFILISLVVFSGSGCSNANSSNATVSAEDQLNALLDKGGYDSAELLYTSRIEIPDSLKRVAADWVKEVVRGASQNLSACDYEDPEDVIEEASKQAEVFFGKTVKITYLHLEKGFPDGGSYVYEEEFNPLQKEIFDHLVRHP